MDDIVILDGILGLSIELRIKENVDDKAENEIDKEMSLVIPDNGMKEDHEDRGLNFKKLDRKFLNLFICVQALHFYLEIM